MNNKTTLRTNSSKPLYEQIKEYILHRIHTGEFEPNTRIPSERDLAEKFDVSRVTVSKAIKELVRAGRLYVQIGKGTYISDPPMRQEIEALTSFTEEMSVRGQDTFSRVLRAEIIAAPDDIARLLDIPQGVSLARLERVRYAGKRPMALEKSSIPASYCADIFERYDFAHHSLYHVLRNAYGVRLISAEQTFEARAATTTEARHLHIDDNAPVLAIHRITHTRHERPCEVVQSVYRGDRYKFRAKLRRI